MNPISTLFEGPNSSLFRTFQRSERAELIKFFVDHLHNKQGKSFPARMIAIKLSHLQVKDLYYIKSVFIDTMRRKGQVAAEKEFWWSLKSK